MDQYFTPPEVAMRLVWAVINADVTTVADFAAGDGELLRAARNRWPHAKLIATDVDPKRIRQLRRLGTDVEVGRCDFLSERSRTSCKVLGRQHGAVSVVLINPPFSDRGNGGVKAKWNGREVVCSKAMAFVFAAVPFLSPNGTLAALLPAGCLTSQKDSKAWRLIREAFKVKAVRSFGTRTFVSCSAKTTLVVLTRRYRKATFRPVKERLRTQLDQVELVRGTVPVFEATNGLAGRRWPFVHTTDIRNGKFDGTERRLRHLRRWITGPAVLLPRVGQPSPLKCVVYGSKDRIVLSDCLFAIKCSNLKKAYLVRRRILEEWDAVSAAYGGTCAPYISLANLVTLLRSLGVEVTSTIPKIPGLKLSV